MAIRDPETAEILQRLGANIVRFREQRGWSRADLATLLGVTKRRLARWENGEHQLPLEHFASLGLMFEVRLDDLIDLTPEDELPPLSWSQLPQ